MCVIFCYVNSNPAPGGYKLILASNRDEFFARETLGAAQWTNAKHVYGGIDLEPGREGGSWLAIGGANGVIKVGALLNLTGEPKNATGAHNFHSSHTAGLINGTVHTTSPTTLQNNNNLLLGRGMIVSDFVSSTNSTIEEYNEKLVSDCVKYSAFNFVSIQISENSSTPANITLCSNTPPGLKNFAEGQCHGFGNSLTSAPFEKVREGQRRFQKIVDEFHADAEMLESSSPRKHEELLKNCLQILKCKEKFWPDDELQRRAPNWGEHMSAINVSIPEAGYGSRTHSVILIDALNKMNFYEETMASDDPAGKWNYTHIEKQYFF